MYRKYISRLACVVGATAGLFSVVSADSSVFPHKKTMYSIPSLSLSEPNPDQFELKQVHIVMRHGARSTCGPAPGQTKEEFGIEWNHCHDESINEPLDSTSRKPCYPGQLTVAGEEMCYELGKRFRARYVEDLGLIGDSFDEQSMYFESTDYARARLSLRRVLDSMFANGPVPQEYLDARQDSRGILHPDIHRCSSLMRHFLQEQKEINDAESLRPELIEMKEKINEAIGSPIMSHVSWVELGDWATSRAFHGMPLVPNLPEDFMPVTEGAAWRSFGYVLSNSADKVRLGIGRLVSSISDRIDGMASGTDNTKFVIYSGHDTTLAPLAKALGIPLLSWPPYSSHVEVELWKSKLASAADGHRDVCLHGTGTMPSIGIHSQAHLLSPGPLDTLPAYGITQQRNGTTTAVDGSKLPHTDSTRHRPTPFVDDYWVRILFNGTVVSAVPLSHFHANVAPFKNYDGEERQKECGEFDPDLKFRW